MIEDSSKLTLASGSDMRIVKIRSLLVPVTVYWLTKTKVKNSVLLSENSFKLGL